MGETKRDWTEVSPGAELGTFRGQGLHSLLDRTSRMYPSPPDVQHVHFSRSSGWKHVMCNAALAAMAEMVLQVLNGDQLEEAAQDTRDQSLDTLQAHGHESVPLCGVVFCKSSPALSNRRLLADPLPGSGGLSRGLSDRFVLVCKHAI